MTDQLNRFLSAELPVQIDHQFDARAKPFAQNPHLIDDTFMRNRCSVLEGIKTARFEVVCHLQACLQRGGRQARHIDRNRFHPLAAQQFDQRLIHQLAEQIPNGNVNAGNRIHVVAAKKTTHAHHVVQVFLNHHRITRVASDRHRSQYIVNDAGDGIRRHDAVGFTPADGAVFCGDLDQHRHVRVRVDGPIALADQVAAAVDGLAGAQRPEVRRLPGDGDDESFNAADFGEIVHGVVSLVSVKLALAGTLPVGHKEVGLFRVKLQAHHCAQANGTVAVANRQIKTMDDSRVAKRFGNLFELKLCHAPP